MPVRHVRPRPQRGRPSHRGSPQRAAGSRRCSQQAARVLVVCCIVACLTAGALAPWKRLEPSMSMSSGSRARSGSRLGVAASVVLWCGVCSPCARRWRWCALRALGVKAHPPKARAHPPQAQERGFTEFPIPTMTVRARSSTRARQATRAGLRSVRTATSGSPRLPSTRSGGSPQAVGSACSRSPRREASRAGSRWVGRQPLVHRGEAKSGGSPQAAGSASSRSAQGAPRTRSRRVRRQPLVRRGAGRQDRADHPERDDQRVPDPHCE